MARPRGWTHDAQELAEFCEDVAFTARAMVVHLRPVLDGSATGQVRLAVETRAALLPALCGRVQRLLGIQARRASRRRRAYREAVLQLVLPGEWPLTVRPA